MILDYFRPTINCGSWSDRFNSTWTFLFLLILSIITWIRHSVGPNATCWTPVEFTRSMVTYTNDMCWLGRAMVTSHNFKFEMIDPYISTDTVYKSRTEDQRTLYQWLPLILFFQAIFFRLPDVILRVCESTFGLGCTQINKMAMKYNSLRSVDKKELSNDIALYCNQLFTSRHLKFLPFGVVTVLVAFVKLLFFINAVTQLSILEGYVSPPNVSSYGEYVINSIISKNTSDIAQSPMFPRKLLCDFSIRKLTNLQRYTVGCVLPVNEFNDQVYFAVWIWLMITCVACGTSGTLFLVKSLLPVFRKRFAVKYLQMAQVTPSPQQVEIFISNDIGQDGILLLEMVGETSSDILVKDIIVNIWHICNKPNPLEMTTVEGKTNPSRATGIEKIYPDPDVSQVRSSETIEMEKPFL